MTAKKSILLSALFCVLAIVFFVLFEFNVISNLTSELALVYVAFFAGMALYYNSVNLRLSGKSRSSVFMLIISLVVILAALGLMVYGFITGSIELWWTV